MSYYDHRLGLYYNSETGVYEDRQGAVQYHLEKNGADHAFQILSSYALGRLGMKEIPYSAIARDLSMSVPDVVIFMVEFRRKMGLCVFPGGLRD